MRELKQRLSFEFGYERAVLFGRARSALVALLESLDADSQFQILIPSNVCPELLAAVWASGANVQLLPIDPTTGLVSDGVLASAIRDDRRGMAIATQLYGFRQRHPLTVDQARRSGWFVLENDTLATGARSVAGSVEPFGDAVLVSFGYSKTIETGGGAILLNDRSLAEELSRKAKAYSPFSEAVQRADAESMLLFREARALPANIAGLRVEQLLLARSIPGLRYGFTKNLEASLNEALDRLPDMVASRHRVAGMWRDALLPFSSEITSPALEPVVPWRLIGLLANHRDEVVQALRAERFDIGTNFPPLARTFPSLLAEFQFEAADIWGEQVINFWVTEDYNASRIEAAVKVVGRVLG